MDAAISLRDVGIRFRVPRRGRRGRGIPRLIGRRRSKFWGIRHVTFDVGHGEVLGLIGPNGSGKSTLLRTVSGIYRPDEGEAVISGRVGPLLSGAAGLEGSLTGWENIELSAVLLGLTRAQAKAIAQRVAEFAEIPDFMDAPVRVYSGGMKARLGFAIAAHTDPEILALDEVISVGDQEFRERSAAKIREFISRGKTVVVASHEVDTIADLCGRFVRLERGRVVDDGPPARVAKRYLDDHGGKIPTTDAPRARRRRAPLWAEQQDI
jgi:ABC-type polysaccharide/polyol phosphate transport system ATPase subunit